MWSLSSETKDLWIENDQAFEQHILRYRRKITFNNYFNKLAAEYLLTVVCKKKDPCAKKKTHEYFFLKKYSIIVTLDLNCNLIYIFNTRPF